MYFVIPAEAGTAGGEGGTPSPEIPASAGMTVQGERSSALDADEIRP